MIDQCVLALDASTQPRSAPLKRITPTIRFLADKRERRRLKLLHDGPRFYISDSGRLHDDAPTARTKPEAQALPAVDRARSLEMLRQKIKDRGPMPRNATHLVDVPPIFSVIRNPAETLQAIYRVAGASLNDRCRALKVDHSRVTFIDLAAEAILDRTVLDVQHDFERRRRAFTARGTLPDDENLKRFLRSVGIIDSLQIEHLRLSPAEQENVRVFKRQSKHAERLKRLDVTDFKEAVLIKFDRYLNECLNEHGWELTARARADLAKYAGEILDNAENHSGTDDWTVIGYLDKHPADHWCELAIFNYGDSIAESFTRLSAESLPLKTIQPYLDSHRSRGLFGTQWNRDDLISVAAMQGHVSSRNLTEEDTRGRGSVDLIHFFQSMVDAFSLGDQRKLEMAILSGSTHIYFDGTHRISPSAENPRPIIAFNKTNDLLDPPDSAYVKNLGALHFPGCIISIRFPIPASHLQEVKK